MTAIPAALASAGPAKSASAPLTRSVPVSGRCTPASILTIVDLPAPFSPTSACASPRVQRKADALHGRHRAEGLRHVVDLEQSLRRCHGTTFPSALVEMFHKT